MRRTAILAFGLLSVIFTGLLLYTSRANSGPGRLDVKNKSITWESSGSFSPGQSGNAEGTFLVRNTGGQPVRIVELKSSCGCTKLDTVPETLLPGQAGEVRVSVLPPAVGERQFSISIETDSPITKTVDLTLRVVSTKPPPFMLKIYGNLAYMSRDLRGDTREIEVLTIVTPDGERRAPAVTCDLPYFRIEPMGHTENVYAGTIDAIQCTYRYRFTATGNPDAGHFVGEMRAVDPWDPGHVETLTVLGEVRRAIRCSPTSIVLREDGDEAQRNAKLLIVTEEPSPGLLLQADEEAPLILSRDGARQTDRYHRFRIELDDRRPIPANAEYSVEVVTGPDGAERETINVKVAGRS